jgi:hypothetical protein
MNGRAFGFGGAGHPVLQALSLLVFAVLLVGAVALGAVIFVAVLAVATLVFAVFAARVWWLRRKLRGAHDGAEGARRAAPNEGRLIEAEYTVVDTSESRDDRDRTRNER